jgi:hypothetical protein
MGSLVAPKVPQQVHQYRYQEHNVHRAREGRRTLRPKLTKENDGVQHNEQKK